MPTVTSKDGTSIVFDKAGNGPAVVLVCGATMTRGGFSPLVDQLAPRFTVFSYDRRGRGDSGDTLPFAVEREVEDLAALIEAAGGSAAVVGYSSGAILAVEAAARGLATRITKLALWEPPYFVTPENIQRFKEYRTNLDSALAAGDRGEAMALFMRLVGVPEDAIAGMRQSPMWQGMEAVAPTLAYDAAAMGDSAVPAASRLTAVAMPALVLNGTLTGAWSQPAADAIAAALPHARRHTLEGQDHNVAAAVIAPVLADFVAS